MTSTRGFQLKKSVAASVLALSMVFSLVPMAGASSPSLDDRGLEQQTRDDPNRPYVYNGDPVANPGWVVSILVGNSYRCSGTLINSLWVLTAAHCVEDANSTFRVNVGADRWFEGQNRKMAAVYIHPGYNNQVLSSVDLGLVKLEAPVSSPELPILASSPSWPVIDQGVLVLGWGQTSTGSAPPDNLQAGSVFVDSDSTGAVREEYCVRADVAHSDYDDFCFGGTNEWACPGDSGGPIVGYSSPTATSGDVRTVYGLTSYGDNVGCSAQYWDPIAQSIGPHIGWISSVMVDVADEQFFYRMGDGSAKYYDMKPSGQLGPLLGSWTYSLGWDSITAVDVDGDGVDEFFFYRSSDGTAKYYRMKPNGTLGALLNSAVYSLGWDSITGIDVDGDGDDEQLFYRSTDGTFKYYRMKSNGTLGTSLASGTYSKGWSSITAVNLDGGTAP